MLLQETRLYVFENENITKVLCDSEYHAVIAMDESEVSRVGRPRWWYGTVTRGCLLFLSLLLLHEYVLYLVILTI